MGDIIKIAVWVSGFIPCYLVLRWSKKKQCGNWTVFDRNTAILVSVTSWLGVITTLIAHQFPSFPEHIDKESKW